MLANLPVIRTVVTGVVRVKGVIEAQPFLFRSGTGSAGGSFTRRKGVVAVVLPTAAARCWYITSNAAEVQDSRLNKNESAQTRTRAL